MNQSYSYDLAGNRTGVWVNGTQPGVGGQGSGATTEGRGSGDQGLGEATTEGLGSGSGVWERPPAR